MMIHDFDRVAFTVFSWPIHWYGITYLVGFALGWWLGNVRAKQPGSGWTSEQVSDLVFYAALGVIVGGRLGYLLFYNPFLPEGEATKFWQVWKGGMSYHGGMLGVFVGIWLFGRRTRKGFFQVADFVAPLVPLGLAAGRIGNFINGELWGKVTDLPWGIVFTRTGGPLPRHPSMLYEFFLEGIVLFLILWLYSRRPRPLMASSALFMLFYGVFRFAVEFVREPDAEIGYLAFGWLTMGQVLSLPMILFGLWLLRYAYRQYSPASQERNT